MSEIVGIVHTHWENTLREMREILKRSEAADIRECLRRNLRSVADNPEDFPEPDVPKPYGIPYWIAGR